MILDIKNVTKSFPVRKDFWGRTVARLKAVDDVSLQIAPGEHLGLVGESGSGKTTLGRLIMKLYALDEGEILLDGRAITSLSSAAFRPLRRQVQMIFQDPYNSLDPRFAVRAILREAFTAQSVPRPEQEERMEVALQSVGLPADSLRRYPHEFSGGERQRIAIARALLMQPRLLILDEAVSSLDVLIQDQILNLLQDLQQRYSMTYLFISHNLKAVSKICPRIAVMYRGAIVECADTKELFARPRHPYTRDLLVAAMEYRAPEMRTNGYEKGARRLVEVSAGHWVRQ